MIYKKEQIADFLSHLDKDAIFGLPTETVYGLAARIDSEIALKSIFSTKQRPFFDPLIVHVSHQEQAIKLTKNWGQIADVLSASFWPGPLTLVLKKADLVSDLITSGLDTVGIRCPAHPLALALIDAIGVPLAAPSANMFGRTSPTSAKHVANEFSHLSNTAKPLAILDGGECEVGIESTILKIDGNKISLLRKGKILLSEIESVLKTQSVNFEVVESEDKRLAPGQMKHHYMPKIPLVFCHSNPHQDKNFKNWLKQSFQLLPDTVEEISLKKPKDFSTLYELKLPSDPVLAARQVYAKLRSADEAIVEGKKPDLMFFIKTELHVEKEVSEAWDPILDRLSKAATLHYFEKDRL
jgi:L-threonylcarbamoyladenylate synthase